MVSTSACHAAGRGSLSGSGALLGVFFFFFFLLDLFGRIIHSKNRHIYIYNNNKYHVYILSKKPRITKKVVKLIFHSGPQKKKKY